MSTQIKHVIPGTTGLVLAVVSIVMGLSAPAHLDRQLGPQYLQLNPRPRCVTALVCHE